MFDQANTEIFIHQAYLERDAADHVHRVDDVPQRLGHLPTVGVTHHRVEIHLPGDGAAKQRDTVTINSVDYRMVS